MVCFPSSRKSCKLYCERIKCVIDISASTLLSLLVSELCGGSLFSFQSFSLPTLISRPVKKKKNENRKKGGRERGFDRSIARRSEENRVLFFLGLVRSSTLYYSNFLSLFWTSFFMFHFLKSLASCELRLCFSFFSVTITKLGMF